MHQEDAIAPVATADHDVEANARERHALLAEARWEICCQHAAEAVRRLRTGDETSPQVKASSRGQASTAEA
jgi:hypothetical protein